MANQGNYPNLQLGDLDNTEQVAFGEKRGCK
jgi:hypothetical protein